MLTMRRRIILLGRLAIEREDRTITRFPTHKTGRLLAHLALYRACHHDREALVELLWPESEGGRGRTNLRVALHALRGMLEGPALPFGSALVADRHQVFLHPQVVTTDVGEFDALARIGAHLPDLDDRLDALARAADLYAGELLPGYCDDWVVQERRRFSEVYRGVVGRLCACLEQRGDLSTAVPYARRAVDLDVFDEQAHIRLLDLFERTGRFSEALRHYAEMERLFLEELGEAPSPETRALIDGIRRHEIPSTAAALVCEPSRPRRRAGNAFQAHPPMAAERAWTPAAQRSLPVRLTRMVGRDAELDCLVQIARRSDTRLMTLTGPVGVGKTALAVELAEALLKESDRIARFVSLADVQDERRIEEAIAHSLRIDVVAGIDLRLQIVASLCRQATILVLDGCEHVIDGVARIVNDLLRTVPELLCVVTSRCPLEVTGEQEIEIRPLPVPPVACTVMDPREDIVSYASVRLFESRAQMVDPTFQITERYARTIGRLCAMLDGVPLFIELAAAHVRAMSPSQMLARLEEGLEWLVDRRRDRPARHASVDAAIASSYRLLDTDTQRLFAKLSVLGGEWTLDEAEDVCGEPAIIEGVFALRAQSMVSTVGTECEKRFRMLDTFRRFADRQLMDGERTALRVAYARPCLDHGAIQPSRLARPARCRCTEILTEQSSSER